MTNSSATVEKSAAEKLEESRRYWDSEASMFDNEPDHGLRDPIVRCAWRDLLRENLPTTVSVILDIGCGTGSLSLLMAELGHTVTGIDLSPKMIRQAQLKAKSAQRQIAFHVMEASYPKLTPQKYDVVLCRHLLWALPKPADVLQRWTMLLKPNGRLLLIEGDWHTGAGLKAKEILKALPSRLTNVSHHELSGQSDLWGGPVADERYLVSAHT
ncbi:MAG: class I SAM-dependent methyltransferase [Chloroflexota bacterium]